MFTIRKAKETDIFSVRRMLKEANINDMGIDQHIQHFFVVEVHAEEVDGEDVKAQMVGAVGMEVYKPYGLLRSFVLDRASWKSEIGLKMVEILLMYAEDKDLEQVYLFAGASSAFFEQIGFAKTTVSELPAEILESDHLKRTIHNGIPMMYKCHATKLQKK
ncbi:hypothetical protein IC620_07050 [Hazenella sp. IB182357]|uniref:N-acetyltransferase domain-containing protein n=1 Tax=Polycladospora coralii TaxID=2771432 RepID=A0A926N9W9_9BACL|nr:hypothetical protein [Polycladospora coralii]MBD1372117.1 hypothetical protein [Polycladospora coralii]MBS7530623.1 hypothetical protein [Polycladospora coralii]